VDRSISITIRLHTPRHNSPRAHAVTPAFSVFAAFSYNAIECYKN
jgi:hypothetical protein